MRNERIDVLFIDSRMLDNNEQLLAKLREAQFDLPVIVIAEKWNKNMKEDGVNDGKVYYVVRDDSFDHALSAALEKVQGMSAISREEEDDLDQQSVLFQQIYKSQKWWQCNR
jgi:DNA-binding NtrC family response regulator